MASQVLWILFLSCGLHAVLAIMVSPDVGQRNHSVTERSAADTIPISNENSQRIRRLIPYMTFYVPPNFPINDYYNLNPINTAYQLYPQPNPASKQIINPFTNHNKLPGSFTPIIYGDPEQVLKSQGPTTEELVEQQKIHGEQQPIKADLSSSTNRPIYYESATPRPLTEAAEELTPQQKYVAYLQQQLQLQSQRLNQQYRQQQNSYLGLSSTTVPPSIDDQILGKTASSTPAPVNYSQISTPVKADPDELYNKIAGQPPTPVKTSQQSLVPSSGIKPNYLEYLQQNPQSFIPVPNLFPLNAGYNAYNPIVYYTTPHPGYTTTINPVYRLPELEPLYQPEPAFRVPVKKPPPQIRQHLTETIQSFAPVLTTYRPNTSQVATPQYNSHKAPPRTEKRKAQRHRPTPTVVTIESGDTNSIHSYEGAPHIRPAYSETPEISSDKDYLLQNEPPLARHRPESRLNSILVQRPQAPSTITESEYESDVVHIPQLRPSPRPSSVLKLRPQSIDEPRYRPDPRPISSYLSHPESKPNFVLEQPQSHSYDELEYHTDNFESSRLEPQPNFEYVSKDKLKTESGIKTQSVDEQSFVNPSEEPLYRPSNLNSELISSHKFSRPDNTDPEESIAKRPQPDPTFFTQHPDTKSEPHIRPSLRPDPVYINEAPPAQTKPVLVAPIKEDSEPEQSHPTPSPATVHEDGHNSELTEDDLTQGSLAEILRKLQDTNQLPKTLTPDNIDNSLRTLIKILNNLKQTQTIEADPPQHHEEEYSVQDIETPEPPKKNKPGPGTGRPGIDYPIFDEIPKTKFNCKEQRYKGFFGDPETSCQVWHYCDLNGGQASFLCPNGTIFSQVALTCDWWFNVKCSTTAQLYVLNERLYKFILPFTPKFPEDYSGPLVDKYLALKFQEMEEKMRRERLKGKLSKENDSMTNNSSANNGTIADPSDDKSESEESSEEDELGNSSIDTGILSYSTTESSPSSTTEITSNSIIPTTQETYSSSQSLPLPSTTTTYAAISPSETGARSGSSNSLSPGANSKTTVESEKVEVIEIRTNGDSGHLNPKLTAYVTQNK